MKASGLLGSIASSNCGQRAIKAEDQSKDFMIKVPELHRQLNRESRQLSYVKSKLWLRNKVTSSHDGDIWLNKLKNLTFMDSSRPSFHVEVAHSSLVNTPSAVGTRVSHPQDRSPSWLWSQFRIAWEMNHISNISSRLHAYSKLKTKIKIRFFCLML